jgi:hypothetical protein
MIIELLSAKVKDLLKGHPKFIFEKNDGASEGYPSTPYIYVKEPVSLLFGLIKFDGRKWVGRVYDYEPDYKKSVISCEDDEFFNFIKNSKLNCDEYEIIRFS